MAGAWAQISTQIWGRAALALAIIAVGLALYALLNRLILARAQHSSLPFVANGRPTILYFTTPDCAPCKTIQRPALQTLQKQLGDRLQVVEVDAAERPDLAGRYGVLSVPTTFIIDARGQLRHVNHGATRADKLLKQVKTVLEDPVSG